MRALVAFFPATTGFFRGATAAFFGLAKAFTGDDDSTFGFGVAISPDMVVAFPASMSLGEIEAACKKLHDKQRPSKKRKTRKGSNRGSAALGETREGL